jgi:predicted permease
MRFYRLLLYCFPKAIRRQFGDEMARMLREHLRETRAAGGSVTRLWLLAVADAVVHGISERVIALRGRSRQITYELGRWRWWVHALFQDVRYAARLLFKQPGVSAIAIVTLALGIGANTAIFSAVNTVLLRPLPYPDPDRLMMLFEKRPAEAVMENPVSPADYLDWSRMQTSFEHIAALSTLTADLTGAGEPERLSAAAVSTPFFDVLGVPPSLGRTFRPEEGIAGQHRVVILGHGLWQRRFGSDASIVGRPLSLNGTPHVVVGVLPATFEFPDAEIDLWAPLVFENAPARPGAPPQPPSRTNHYLTVYGRLKSGVSVEQARTEMDRIGAELSREYPQANRNHSSHVAPLRDQLTQPFRTGLLLLLAAVSFVLLIACVNVANLLLAKAASRRREMAVRAALGAGRTRLAGQALTESLLLGLVGGALGLLVARWGIDLLRTLAPRGVPVLGLQDLGLDARVLAFALLISIASGVLFGLLPAWHLAGQDVNDSLKDGGRGGGRGVRRRLRLALVVSEIALASLLLVGAGLTLRSFQALLDTDAGFTTDRLLTALVSLPATRYQGDERIVTTYDEIERRFAALPGVRAVGGTSHLPLTNQDSRSGVAVEGRQPSPDAPTRAHLRAVTVDYFRTMGIRLVAGRNFNPSEDGEQPFVVIVNETMARRYWPGNSPLGKRVRLGGSEVWREVVGIVADVKHWGLERPVNPELYFPQRQMVWRSLNFVVATDGDPASLVAAVREQLRAVDADLPLSNVRTMDQVAARSVAERRGGMLILGLFGVLALILAAAGIYGVMAHLVALRTSEIGIRMTLGAQPSRVMTLVLKEGLMQAALGLAIGIAGAVLVMRSFRTVLYGVGPADPLTIVAVVVVLAATATLACLIPARRAMRVDPVTALRAD